MYGHVMAHPFVVLLRSFLCWERSKIEDLICQDAFGWALRGFCSKIFTRSCLDLQLENHIQCHARYDMYADHIDQTLCDLPNVQRVQLRYSNASSCDSTAVGGRLQGSPQLGLHSQSLRLHFTRTGYAILGDLLRPHLLAAEKRKEPMPCVPRARMRCLGMASNS